MKNFLKLLGIIAVVAVVGFTMTGCVHVSSIGGTGDPHGLFSGGGAKSEVTAGAQEIASYSVILNLFDSGYADYVAAVKAAEAEGKLVTTTTTWLVFLSKVTAYAQ
jgi:hypothetical protein